ncbi:uncharacterized protein LOC108665130 [Hyalella azteca]|uniref:Uncharacterized protein LOC108665130 n=1 Tax=Hyalella azteca TaxID=294128 RepID=A0A8B7N0J3_HYAAZ|nr:uncharacterized protein LOC108665130 [Hyalella azteca]
MATLTPLTLTRSSEATPWGFRLSGGADYKSPLIVQRVTAGSIAAQHLSVGDAIILLEGEDAKTLCHFDACDLVKHSCKKLSMTVRKASSIQYLHEENRIHQEKLEQIVVAEQKQQELERKYKRAMSTPPLDTTTSNRSTPQLMLSSPACSIASHRNIQSPPTGPISDRNVQSPPTGPISDRNVQSPPTGPISNRNVQSPPTGPISNRNIQSPPTGPISNRNVQSPPTGLISPPWATYDTAGITSPPNAAYHVSVSSPSLKCQAGNTSSRTIAHDEECSLILSPVMKNVTSPSNRSTPINVSSPIVPLGIGSPHNTMSPTIVQVAPNHEPSTPITSPPPQCPKFPTNNPKVSSDRFFARSLPPAVENSSPSFCSAQGQVLSSSQTSTALVPTTALSPPFPSRDERDTDQEILFVEQKSDAQRRQLQLMIQEKLRLEEKMMIAKRREGIKAERMLNSSPAATAGHVPMRRDATSKIKSSKATISNPNLEIAPATLKKEASSTLLTAVKLVQQELQRTKNAVSDQLATKDTGNMSIKTEIPQNQVPASQTAIPIAKAASHQEEANKILERLKKTAREKIAEFQKNFALTRCVDEKEQLREANRIRDELIRKMQEHNFDQKQNKTAPKSACEVNFDENIKGSQLRKVKTEIKPGQVIATGVLPESAKEITDSLDGKTSTMKSTTSRVANNESMIGKIEPCETDRAKSKESKRKNDLRKIQEQFKKDQLLIQQEMEKKKAKSQQEKQKVEKAQDKQDTDEENLRKLEEKKVLAKLIYEEEQKLLAQKKEVEERIKYERTIKEETSRQADVQMKIAREKENYLKAISSKDGPSYEKKDETRLNRDNDQPKKNIKSITESYERLKLRKFEKKRIEMQRSLQEQHVRSARQVNETIRRQSCSNLEEAHIYEDVPLTQPPEEKLDTLKQEEERQMRKEAEQYEEYRRHLETKRRAQVEDSDDYASEWDESSEASNQVFDNNAHDPEEPFDELKATSEEELLEAQEKSIRNLERQIRKQKEKDRRRNSDSRLSENQENPVVRSRPQNRDKLSQIPQRSQSERRASSSTGDLRRSNSRTLPVTKFSPDPMEFGFKPIENPVLSKSMSNLENGGSAESGAAVAGAQAGAKATMLVARPVAESGLRYNDGLSRTHSMSASLGDLQQVSSKPPLPAGAGRARMRHATSDEWLNRSPWARNYEDGRRFTYAPGEDLNLVHLEPLHLLQEGYGRDSWGCDEDGAMDLQTMEGYNKLLSEYYAAYYEAYYLSYYRKQQEDLKSGKGCTMNGPAGPPPPPPPPPFVVAGATPPALLQPAPAQGRPSARGAALMMPLAAPPAALAGAMMKDKKPFTYTPGGLDLSEIRSPRMQRRLSRNAALEGVRPSPLAQTQPQSPVPGITSPAATSGIAVQVLPMPGMSMTKAIPTPPASAKLIEPPPLTKNVCGPPPPPPPFAIGLDIAPSSSIKSSVSPQASVMPVSPVSPAKQASMQGDLNLNTPSSPAFSLHSSDPRSPSPSLVSTNTSESGGSDGIPAPPPMPPQCSTARRASLLRNEDQANAVTLDNSKLYLNAANNNNISPTFSAGTESDLNADSSSLAMEDVREGSVTPSLTSNIEKASEKEYSSNESLLKQISALEQITARHQSIFEDSKNEASNISSNDADVYVQPILRLSTKSRTNENDGGHKEVQELKSTSRQKHEAEDRRENETVGKQEQKIKEIQSRVSEEKQKQQAGDQQKLELEEKQRREIVERSRIERENSKEVEEKKRREAYEEDQEKQRLREEEDRTKAENELRQKLEMEQKMKREEEQRQHEAHERQRREETKRLQELESQRIEEERLKAQKLEIQKQRDLELKKQETEWQKLHDLEAQQQRELENHKFEDGSGYPRGCSQVGYQQPGYSSLSPTLKAGNNRFVRMGSVPAQRRLSIPTNTSDNQPCSTTEDQNRVQEKVAAQKKSPNISPTTGLIKAPLPWMSAVPRREASAPPEFVNYAQVAQARLQQQRSQRQQSKEESRVQSAPSPTFKKAVISSPPVVFQHGVANFQLEDAGSNTLPRQNKQPIDKSLSGPVLRPWAIRHREYQQQKTSQDNSITNDSHATPRQHVSPSSNFNAYGQSQHSRSTSVGSPRWPEVQAPIYLRQPSAEAATPQSTSLSGPRVRIVPIVMEQDSSSDAELAYASDNPLVATCGLGAGALRQNQSPTVQLSASTSSRTSAAFGSLSTPSTTPKWPSGQPPFKIVRPDQQQIEAVRKNPGSAGPMYCSNPASVNSEGDAVEALQQMQQSLAQLNSGLQNAYPKFIQEKMSSSLPTRGVNSPGPAAAPECAPVQSRSFRVLQQVVDNEASGSDDEIRGLMNQGAPLSYQTAQSKTFTGGSKGRGQRQSNFVESPLVRPRPTYPDECLRDHQGLGVSESSNAIPSRTFRALQQHTDGIYNDAEVTRPSTTSPHPTSFSPSVSPVTYRPSNSSSSVEMNSSNKTNGFASYSQPLSGQTYKTVAPHIVVSNLSQPKIVNSALSKQRAASPSRWHVSTSNASTADSPRGPSPLAEDQSRLRKFLSEEAAANANSNGRLDKEPKKLYDGAHIPSRVFRQLQSEFSDSSETPSANNPTPCKVSVKIDKPELSAGLLRLLQSDQNKLQNDNISHNGGDASCVSTFRVELDEYHNNGMANTAVRKESVLKELTTQFESSERKKPRAAPGKVFRYLQQTYDSPEDDNDSEPNMSDTNGLKKNEDYPRKNSLDNRSKTSRFHSPSFNILQTQYKDDESNARVDPHDLTSLKITEEGDPIHSKPYVGQRIPGKTFRMLQENYASHPSVLQARK